MESCKVRVLLVDDDEDDYVITRDLLSLAHGSEYVVDWAPTYEAGLEAAERGDYDVFLVDYLLDGHRSGLDLIKGARATGWDAPVIMLTGQGDQEVDVEAMNAGASDYLEKGQMNQTLLDRAIRYAIDRQRPLTEPEQGRLREQEERRKRTEEALREASRLASVGELAAGLAHEINNPLNCVMGFTQLLLAEDLPQHIQADLSKVYSQAERAAKIVKNLLSFARKHEPNKQYVDLRTTVERVLELKSTTLELPTCECTQNLQATFPLLWQTMTRWLK